MEKNGKIKKLGTRIIKAQSILVWSAVILLLVASYAAFRYTYLNFYNEKAKDILRVVTAEIDSEVLKEYIATGEENEKTTDLQNFMNRVKENFTGVGYMYIFVPYEDHFVYIMEAHTPADDLSEYSYYGDVYNYTEGEFKNLVPDVQAKRASEKPNLLKGYLGTTLGVWRPVLDQEGNLIAMIEADYMVYDINRHLNTFVGGVALFFVITSILMNLFMNLYLRRNLSTPLSALSASVDSYEHGDLNIQMDAFPQDDELKRLALSFDDMTKRIEQYTEEVKRVTAEKARIGAELNVATKIQEDMLPKLFPAFPDYKEFDVFATMDPAKEVGGDFYDFFMVDEDHVAFVIADVSSKGVPAALFMVIAKTLIKNQTQYGDEPASVFDKVNDQLCEGNDEGMFVTAWMGVLTISTGDLVYVNAGHNPFLLLRDGTWQWIKPDPGFILAGLEGFQYKANSMKLQPGDRIYTYTDGVTEAQDLSNELFGEDRLLQSLSDHTSSSLRDLLKQVREDVDAFVGEAPQFDDITMLTFEYKG